MDMKSCAEYLGVSGHDVRRMIRNGSLEVRKEGKLILFDLTQVHVLRRKLSGLRKEME